MKLTKLLVATAAAALVAAAPVARATIVERVVAVIGERPVLWTELLHRAMSGRVQIRTQTRDPNVISVQEQEMYKELLDRMIDDRLEEQQADKAHISVTPEEIDRGIANIASQAQAQQGRAVTTTDVLDEVRRRGLTEQDFRDEIRRQILEGKLIELRVRPRVHVTDQDAHVGVPALGERGQRPGDRRRSRPRPSRARRPPRRSSSTTASSARKEIAERWPAAARTSASSSRSTATTSPAARRAARAGPQPFGSLLPRIQDAVRATKPGGVSDPVPVNVGQEEAIVLVMPLGAARVPAFTDVKDDMMQKALIDGLERARKQWLADLRRNVYIDVRL